MRGGGSENPLELFLSLFVAKRPTVGSPFEVKKEQAVSLSYSPKGPEGGAERGAEGFIVSFYGLCALHPPLA